MKTSTTLLAEDGNYISSRISVPCECYKAKLSYLTGRDNAIILAFKHIRNHMPHYISKLLIKAVERNSAKGKKDNGETFTLRDLNPSALRTCTQLKALIKAQLDADLVDEFDIGHIKSNAVVSL